MFIGTQTRRTTSHVSFFAVIEWSNCVIHQGTIKEILNLNLLSWIPFSIGLAVASRKWIFGNSLIVKEPFWKISKQVLKQEKTLGPKHKPTKSELFFLGLVHRSAQKCRQTLENKIDELKQSMELLKPGCTLWFFVLKTVFRSAKILEFLETQYLF